MNGLEPVPVLEGPRMRLMGPVLAIDSVQADDAGAYKCTASNMNGESTADLRLTVSTPLQVEVSPNVMSVNMGSTAEFRCLISAGGNPVSGIQQINWFKDGRQLPSSGRIGETLLIPGVGREDKGMYQCVVKRQEGDTIQASAELQLGGNVNPTVIQLTYINHNI